MIATSDFEEIAASPLSWDRLDGATLLLTGATGLVGGYLLEALAARSRLLRTEPTRFILLTRSPDKAAARFAHLAPAELLIVEHQLDAPLRLEEHADFVIHAGAPATPTEFVDHPIGSYVPNVIGTHYLLGWAAEHEVERFMFVSSGSVHGPLLEGTGAHDEHTFGPIDPLDPYSCYAESKRMGEAACLAWYRQCGLATTVARLGHTYGPGLSRSDTRSFAEFVFDAVDGRDIVLRSAGTTRRPFCYLSDAVTGLVLTLLEGTPGEAYFVVNTDAVMSIRALAELIVGLSPHPGIAVRFDGPALSAAHPAGPDDIAMPDTSRLRSLGWRPTVTPAEGFRRTIEAHRRS